MSLQFDFAGSVCLTGRHELTECYNMVISSKLRRQELDGSAYKLVLSALNLRQITWFLDFSSLALEWNNDTSQVGFSSWQYLLGRIECSVRRRGNCYFHRLANKMSCESHINLRID